MKIFFDGGCRGRVAAMEIAVVAAGDATIVRDLGPGTSGDAEWLALIHALGVAISLDLHDVTLVGDAADVIAKANGAKRCRGDAHHLARFRGLIPPGARLRLRRVKRSQNLAGIALARLYPR